MPQVLGLPSASANLESVTRLAVVLAWLAGAIAAAYLTGWLVTRMLCLLGRRGGFAGLVNDLAELTRRPFRTTLMLIAANIVVASTTESSASWRGWFDHLLRILIIGAITWLCTSLLLVGERRVIAGLQDVDGQIADGDRHRRRVRTQVMTLRRLTVVMVIILGLAAAVMTFPSFKQIGATLFASAGVLSVVAGLAAQTSLGSVFAGMQISFSDAIRVGDVVVLEGQFGRIEEITLTYVVVQVWDQRRLVLPTTYFTTTPFENWTRNATELFGTVEFDVDFTVPLDPMRDELDRLLAASQLWDGRASSLVVTDAVGGYLRVRVTVSAPDSGALFSLRCAVREGLVDWLRRTHPAALPRWRVEQPPGNGASDELVGATPRRG